VPVTWQLQGVEFDSAPYENATATGSFVYDADTGVHSDISIITSSDFFNAGSAYNIQVGFASSAGQVGFSLDTALGPAPFQGLVFESDLTSAGGTANFAKIPVIGVRARKERVDQIVQHRMSQVFAASSAVP
jgi:hypothetical protein